MMFRKLQTEDGIGLIQAVAAAFIVAISIAGLFIASYITQHKAVGVYHYRVALLKGLEKMEEIKFQNRNNSDTQPVDVQGIQVGNFVIDEMKGERIIGTIHPISVSFLPQKDSAISPYARYHEVELSITWYDGPRYYFNEILNKQRQIILREDYFYLAEQVR